MLGLGVGLGSFFNDRTFLYDSHRANSYKLGTSYNIIKSGWYSSAYHTHPLYLVMCYCSQILQIMKMLTVYSMHSAVVCNN